MSGVALPPDRDDLILLWLHRFSRASLSELPRASSPSPCDRNRPTAKPTTMRGPLARGPPSSICPSPTPLAGNCPLAFRRARWSPNRVGWRRFRQTNQMDDARPDRLRSKSRQEVVQNLTGLHDLRFLPLSDTLSMARSVHFFRETRGVGRTRLKTQTASSFTCTCPARTCARSQPVAHAARP